MAKGTKKHASTNMKVRRMAKNVIMVCLALIILVSGYKVYTILKDYWSNQGVYDELSEKIQKGGFTGDINFDMLRQINPDVVGWLYWEGTPINYPVVQGEDNDKYLHTLFDGTYGFFGTLFVDSITEAPFRQFNTIVYGHHMKDGSMLASISKLTDPSWCDEHPQLELITPDNKYHLEIWAFLNQPADSSVYTTNFHDADMQADYLGSVQSLAAYTTDVSVAPDDMIVLLSTCVAAEGEARYIAVCKMVPWE